MDYSTFSENPNLYFMSILLAMAITLLAYGAGPLPVSYTHLTLPTKA